MKTLTCIEIIVVDFILCGCISIPIAAIWHTKWALVPLTIGILIIIIVWAKGLLDDIDDGK